MGFLVLGAAKVLDEAGVVDVHARALLALLMISIGLAFFLMLARNTRDWHLAIPGLFFAGLGGLMFLAELGYSPGWEVRDAIRHFWPVALILFGVSLLLNRKAA
jgi:hypothetical protein